MTKTKSIKTEKIEKVTKPKRLQGKVIKLSSDKTIKVLVETKYTHALYKKIIKEHKKYLAHCEDSTVAINDVVIIEEGRPVSRNKSFYFVKKLS